MRPTFLIYGAALIALNAPFAAPVYADSSGQATGTHAGDGGYYVAMGYGDYGSFFSDAPFYAQAYRPNYVAPPAPPPPPPATYVDGRLATYCRDISLRVRVGNDIQESFGTACLQPDGNWRVIQ
jgi:hypothetical protein